tara:strand:- start:2304 stop:2546 length:243 start_codon:yes stop_codon:yes gene_type:complete
MSALLLGLIISISFCLGFMLGSYLGASKLDRMNWQVLKWNKDVIGYRPVAIGSSLKKDDKIIMGFKINTSSIPEEGWKVE